MLLIQHPQGVLRFHHHELKLGQSIDGVVYQRLLCAHRLEVDANRLKKIRNQERLRLHILYVPTHRLDRLLRFSRRAQQAVHLATQRGDLCPLTADVL